MEREVEAEFRASMLAALQNKIAAAADAVHAQIPVCPQCGRPMWRHDRDWITLKTQFGDVRVEVVRFRCSKCPCEGRPALDGLGMEVGGVSGSLARRLALLGTVVPYELAASLAKELLGVDVDAMTVWRAVQRLGEAAEARQEGLDAYHSDSRTADLPKPRSTEPAEPPKALIVSVDGSMLGMQVRSASY
jgi:hypothetical protein